MLPTYAKLFGKAARHFSNRRTRWKRADKERHPNLCTGAGTRDPVPGERKVSSEMESHFRRINWIRNFNEILDRRIALRMNVT